ncbi:MAG: hypothetical protein DI556_03375 [Rhodovulum sulfidophilum]|uniref:Calcium-binding protein n=1 Tax=Rhodovulum sulfidophilum TaxID=35806 RepID=A0A2W5NDM5_RHOSU|nr:MAG: hypothetical protein DI556_03375 [Rhodovulum sulfidophilum]
MDITGTEDHDVLTGTAAADRILGLGGADRLSGLGGADLLEGGTGNDTLEGGAGNDTLYGENSGGLNYGSFADLLLGGAGADRLYGGEGDDTLDGGTGTDRLDGGLGFDTVLYEVNTTPLVVDLVAGLVSFPGQTWASETLVSIEAVRAGSGADSLIGDDVANFLHGGLGNDTLIGGGGDDTLEGGGGRDRIDGGDGSDMAVYAENTTPLRVDLGTGVVAFVGQSWPAETLVSIEGITTGSGNDTVRGTAEANVILTGAGADSLAGGGGADHLDGGSGADTMIGGLGSDTYVVDDAGDRVIESTGGTSGGVDTVHSSVSFTLGANLEHLTLTGVNSLSGTGNGLGNILAGGDGWDALTGLGGADTLSGGLGNDTLSGGSGNDLLAGGAYAAGGTSPRIYVAPDEGYDWRPPNDGRDQIDGGAGTDTLVYAQYIYDDGAGYVTPFLDRGLRIDLGAGTARAEGLAQVDRLVSVENVATGNADDTVTGSGGANEIWVYYGFNSVDGGGGNDTIHGGQGLRFPYAIDEADYVYGLGDTIEVLRGGAGDDVISSGGAIAYYDAFHGWWQTRASDALHGDAGNDRLVAGDGGTVMTGGVGADRFEFSTALWEQSDYGEYYLSYAQTGTITDFSRSEGDKILIDGAVAGGASFVGETDDPGLWELAYHRVTTDGQTDTLVELRLGDSDSNGDGGANETLRITLADYSGALAADDFLLT